MPLWQVRTCHFMEEHSEGRQQQEERGPYTPLRRLRGASPEMESSVSVAEISGVPEAGRLSPLMRSCSLDRELSGCGERTRRACRRGGVLAAAAGIVASEPSIG